MEEINKERWARCVALERDYVHQVYERIGRDLEQAVDPLQNTVRKFLNELEPGSIVADVGCGGSGHIQQRDGLYCIGTGNLISNPLQLPLRTSAFDAVLSVGLLHHLASRERRIQALRELARILKVGGRVLIAVRSHQRSQDILLPWYDLKKKGERYQDEDSGEYDLEDSDCDSISLSPSDDDEPSVESATDKFVHTIFPTGTQQGRSCEPKSRSLDGENSHQEVRANVFHDFVQNVLKRFSSDVSVSTSHQWTDHSSFDCEVNSKLEFDEFSLPKNVEDKMNNYIELRNIDEARVQKDLPKEVKGHRRRSLTDIFKNLWTPKSRLDPGMRHNPLKRSMTTATCNSTFQTYMQLESIGEFDMTISEADKIVNDFLNSSLPDGQSIRLRSKVGNESMLSQTLNSKCLDSYSSSLSCANEYSAINGDKESLCQKSLHLPQKSHTAIHNSLDEQEHSDIFPEYKPVLKTPDFSKVKSKDYFEYKSGIDEFSDSTEKQMHFLSSLDDNKISLTHKQTIENNLDFSKCLDSTNEFLLKSKYCRLSDVWDDDLINCSLKLGENKIFESLRERVMFLYNQDRNLKEPSEMFSVDIGNELCVSKENCKVLNKISRLIEPFHEDGKLSNSSLLSYSMPELHSLSKVHKMSSGFSFEDKNRSDITNLIRNENHFGNKRLIEYPEVLESKLCKIDGRVSKEYRYPLHRSLTVPFKYLYFKNDCLINGVNNEYSRFPPTKQFSNYVQLPKPAFISSLKRSQSFDGLNHSLPTNNKTVSEPEHSNNKLKDSKSQSGDGDISAAYSLHCGNGHNENHYFDVKQPNERFSSVPLQCSIHGNTYKTHSSRIDCILQIDSEKDTLDKPSIALHSNNKFQVTGKVCEDSGKKNCAEELNVQVCGVKTEELSSQNFLLKSDGSQGTCRKAPQCISEKKSNELTECKEDRTNELIPSEKQPLIVNYSYGRIHEKGATVVMHRYYHLFEKDELSVLIEKHVNDLHILEYFQYQSHWCIVAEKVRVWTI